MILGKLIIELDAGVEDPPGVIADILSSHPFVTKWLLAAGTPTKNGGTRRAFHPIEADLLGWERDIEGKCSLCGGTLPNHVWDAGGPCDNEPR